MRFILKSCHGRCRKKRTNAHKTYIHLVTGYDSQKSRLLMMTVSVECRQIDTGLLLCWQLKTMSDNHLVNRCFVFFFSPVQRSQSGLKVTSELLKSDKQYQNHKTRFIFISFSWICRMKISHFADGLCCALIQPQSSANGLVVEIG